jgi:hypothetical protein
VTSTPSSAKYPFSFATAKGAPYINTPQCVTVRSIALAGVAANTGAATAAKMTAFHDCIVAFLPERRTRPHGSVVLALWR